MAIGYNPLINTDGLVMYIDAANTRSYSGSGNAANGLIGAIGGTLVNSVTFSSSNAGNFVFNGSNNYINFGNSATVQQSSGTLSAWVKSSSPGGSFRGIIAKQGAYGLFFADSILVTYDWGAAATRSTGLNIADGNWKNVVMTYQLGVTNGTKIYLNGSSVLTTTISLLSQSMGNLFGGAEANASQFAACSASSFNMYNRVLTAQEVLQNYTTTKSRYAL